MDVLEEREQDALAAQAAKRAKVEGIVRIAMMFVMPLVMVGMMITTYLGTMHHPHPRDMPVAVVGQGAAGFAAELEAANPDAVDSRELSSAEEARRQVLAREAEPPAARPRPV